MLFGRDNKSKAKTVLILDIESGSVGAALARRDADNTLHILEETRTHLPVRLERSAQALAADIERLSRETITHISRQATDAGGVDNIAVFMAPPWGKPNLTAGAPDFALPMQTMLRRELSPYFASPASFYTNAGAAVQGMRAISPYEDKYLLCIVTHEMTELLLVHQGAVVGHATIPHGLNLPLRTLRTHGGLSEAEARSALKLGHLTEPLGRSSWPMGEALASATETFATEFLAAGRELFEGYAPERVWVVSPAGDYFARALSHHALDELFVQGGTVAALRPHHVQAHLPNAGSQDLFIILEALFVLYS